MNRLVLVCAALVSASCAKSEGASMGEPLPPPTGEGVKAAAIPAVSELMKSDEESGRAPSSDFSATGTLYPREQAELGPKVTGVIRSIEVDEGDPVKKGQVLFRLDGGQAALMLQQAQTQVASAKTQLAATELEYQRARELHARGSLPQAQFEQIQARYDGAKNAVAQAEVAVSLAKRSIQDTVVTSPISGVVSSRQKEPGETATMMPPTTVVVIQDVSVLELRTRLPEGALKTLRPGSELQVVVPAIGAERKVNVERINPSVDMATRTIEVIAKLDNADGTLKPGMLANVTLASDAQKAQPTATEASSAQATAGAQP